jgi:hypothetical protein
MELEFTLPHMFSYLSDWVQGELRFYPVPNSRDVCTSHTKIDVGPVAPSPSHNFRNTVYTLVTETNTTMTFTFRRHTSQSLLRCYRCDSPANTEQTRIKAAFCIDHTTRHVGPGSHSIQMRHSARQFTDNAVSKRKIVKKKVKLSL